MPLPMPNYEHAALVEVRRLLLELNTAKAVAQRAEECDKRDCSKAMSALSSVGYVTPQETYGTDTTWAINDLCACIKIMHERYKNAAAGHMVGENQPKGGNKSLSERVDRARQKPVKL